MQTSPDTWHEIWFKDPALLSGVSVRSFVGKLIDRFGVRWVRISDVEGAGVSELVKRMGETVPVRDFLNLVSQPTQYDWAFFFMYMIEPSTNAETEISKNLTTADMTVRLDRKSVV